MNWEPLVALGVALLGLVGTWLQRQGPGKDRRRLRADAELFELLPEGSVAKQRMGQHLEAQIERLLAEPASQGSRIISAVFEGLLAFLFMGILGGGLIWLGYYLGGWWWIAGAFGFFYLLAAFVAGLSIAADELKAGGQEETNTDEAEPITSGMTGLVLRLVRRKTSGEAGHDQDAKSEEPADDRAHGD